jgi:transposase
MRKLREVMRLRFELHLGYQQIGRSCAIGVSTVCKYLQRAEAAGVTWPLPEGWDEARLETALFSRAAASVEERPAARSRPDFASIHEQLRQHRHVTLQLLWEEYREANPDGYRYSRFCELYQRWRSKLDVVLRQEHKAGEKMFVDWAGSTIPVYDRHTGAAWRAPLFVATLGASSYTWAEATRDQQMEAWLRAHVHAFEHFGGIPALAVPDNAKTGVTKAHRYDPDLNPTYYNFALHCGFGIVPARPRKPRDKAYVSYCTSSRPRNGEDWLLGPAASMAFENRAFVQRFVKATAGIVVTVLLQPAFSGPKVDCSGGHAVPHAHLFGGEQPLGPQSAVATLQIEGLPDMGNLFQAEWFVLPGPPALSIQDFRDFPITVIIEQSVDLGDDVRLCLANLGDRQRSGQCKTSSGAAAETYMNLDRLPVYQGHILNE